MPMRSLTLLPGLNISSLASSVGRRPRFSLGRRTMGVLPDQIQQVVRHAGQGAHLVA